MKFTSKLRLLQSLSGLLFIVFAILLSSVIRQYAQISSINPTSAQWTAANSTQFSTINHNDASIKKPIDATNISAAAAQLNQDGAIIGTVLRVSGAWDNEVTIIRFTEHKSDGVIAVVHSKDYTQFPPLNSLQGQKVLITGKFSLYKSQKGVESPQISLTDASQASIVK